MDVGLPDLTAPVYVFHSSTQLLLLLVTWSSQTELCTYIIKRLATKAHPFGFPALFMPDIPDFAAPSLLLLVIRAG